jgi:hypothetical protein
MGSIILNLAKWFGIILGTLLVILIVGFVLVPPLTRGLTDRWGATPDECSATLPGDDAFPATRELSTKAITIDAPPATVYALVQQMGQHRAGWYGWDWFYNMTNSSDFVDGHYSKRIVPELQDVKVGDKININDMVAYDVIVAEPGEALVLAAGSLKPEQRGPQASMPETWTENTLGFILRPTESGGTRLLLRMRADGSETGFARWIWNGPVNFGSALFSYKTIVGLKRVAENLER